MYLTNRTRSDISYIQIILVINIGLHCKEYLNILKELCHMD
jgi:hypothetical protein